MNPGTAISIRRLSRAYGSTPALRDVSLEVGRGELLGLVGPNGSGKSTLLRIAATLDRADGGRLVYFGKDEGLPLSDLRARIGVLFDHAAHWDALTGYENAWLFARCYGLEPEEAHARLDALFARLGLDDRRDGPVSGYSFGMRRKLSIIEALAHRPRLLLLDEPSLGLDHTSRLELHALLREAADDGAAVLFSTNDVREAQAHAARIALLARGRVLVTGSPDALVRSLRAATRVELDLAATVDLAALEASPGVLSVAYDGTGLRVGVVVETGGDPAVARVVEAVTACRGRILGLRVAEPDLGDVFVRYLEAAHDAP
jgi:ABC-type multidrug transport system ATPase subunit